MKENNLIDYIYNSLTDEFKKKFEFSQDNFKTFFTNYILNTVDDSELSKELFKKADNLIDGYNNIVTKDFLENDRVLLRTIRVLTMLELSKDYKDFNKYNQLLTHDKTNAEVVEFDKVMRAILKVKK